jgi:hypothetical protein
MYSGEYTGQRESFVANNLGARESDLTATEIKKNAAANQKSTEVSAKILEVVKRTKTDQQEGHHTQAIVIQELSVGLKQLQARTSQLCQESAQTRQAATGIS